MRRLLYLVAILGFGVPPTPAAPASVKTRQDIEQLFDAYYKTGRFQGSVLVADGGGMIFKKGFGFANIELGVPNAPDTKFRLGSITKQFTAMLILQLVEKGKVRLEGKISDYVPEYPLETGERITVHQLLTHQSGIPNYTTPEFFDKRSRDHFSPVDLAKTFWNTKLDFDPGARFSYSNSGYHVLGIIIEKVAGKPYEQVLRENILAPLEMRDTGYDNSDAILPKRAAGYRKTLDGFENARFLDMSIPYSAGALYSTVEDLQKWDSALYTEKLVPTRSLDMMFQPRVKMDGPPGAGNSPEYAYGWVIENWTLGGGKQNVRVIGHGGGINGFNTSITRLPADHRLIVILSNANGVNWDDASKNAAAILYGDRVKLPKPSIAGALYDTLKVRGITAAVTRYRDLKSNHAQDYGFEEPVLDQLGHQLLERKKVREAIEIFKLNVEAYPASADVYDSLGEAYKSAGERELAIQNYRKALEMNPKNENAAKALKELDQK